MDDYLDVDKLFDPSNGGMIEMVQLPDIFLGHPTVRVTVWWHMLISSLFSKCSISGVWQWNGYFWCWYRRIYRQEDYLRLVCDPCPQWVWSWHLLVIYNLCKHSFQWTLIVWFVLGCNNSKIIEKLFVILLLLSFNPIRCRGCKGPFIKHFKDLQIFVEIILHSSGDTWPNWKFVYPFKKIWY